jgi:hypothetical protein
MGKRLTTEEFIEKARKVHGDKYDYSKAEYVNSVIKVCIICPIHGEFWQNPNSHMNGVGCKECYYCSKKAYGVAKLDIPNAAKKFPSCYNAWRSLLKRTVENKLKHKWVTYSDCTICDEWLTFSVFLEWFNKQIYFDSWQLDKDILAKGNKIYSPETCAFVPQEINSLFSYKTKESSLPVGVTVSKKRFASAIHKQGKRYYLGNFKTPEEAFQAYKVAKEAWIKEVADKWRGKIDPKVYKAMYEYQVEITD